MPSSAFASSEGGSPVDGPSRLIMSMGRDITVANLDVVPGLDVSTRIGTNMAGMVPFVTIDLISASADDGDEKVSGRLLTVGAGARYFLSPLAVGGSGTYVVGEAFTALPKTDIDKGTDEMVSDVKSLGLLGGFGAEYLAAPSVSVSGEVGVMRFGASYEDDDLKASALNLYSSVLLTFYL